MIAFGPDAVEERDIEDVDDLRRWVGRHRVTWVDVAGLGDAATLQAVGDAFGLHRLALEDVVNVYQRPKIEPYAEHHFVVARVATVGEAIGTEQISLFLGSDYVLTFQERPGDDFDPVRERIRSGRPTIRSSGPDYLAYALIDAVVDGFFPVIEVLGDRLERLEDDIVERPSQASVTELHAVRHDLLVLRRAVWPQREVVHALSRDTTAHIAEETRVFLRDCYDHAVQLLDLIENYRDIATSLHDLYLSSVNNRLSEVMTVLTLIATIFIPLSFIAGVYGMNFSVESSPLNMPELRWYWGYPFALALMAAVAGGLTYYFRRRGWIGTGASARRRDRTRV